MFHSSEEHSIDRTIREDGGKPLLSSSRKDTGGMEGQALRDGACLPHPSANSLAPRPLLPIYIQGWCTCAWVKGGGGGGKEEEAEARERERVIYIGRKRERGSDILNFCKFT